MPERKKEGENKNNNCIVHTDPVHLNDRLCGAF